MLRMLDSPCKGELKMLMVVLGAGASHDSTPRFITDMEVTGLGGTKGGFRPPLADQLFATRFRKIWDKFPDIEPLIPRLHSSIEATLQRFQEEAEFDPERHKQLMAIRHYVPRIIGICEDTWCTEHRITNHAGLLDIIRSWCVRKGERVCFVTFNYDGFIEKAFWNSPLGIGMRQLDDYIENDRYKVIKLHGSVNWFHEVEAPAIRFRDVPHDDEGIILELIDRAEEVRVRKEIRVAEWTTVGRVADSGPVVIPAIAIPVQEKRGPAFDECPPEHVEALRACIPFVNKVMLIGWQGKEKAFLKMLENLPSDALGMVVGAHSADAEKIRDGLVAEIPGSYKASQANGFSKFIEEGFAEEFLSMY